MGLTWEGTGNAPCGSAPVAASYSITPAENRSERRSIGPPRRCSGDMYGSVPITAAVSVSRVSASAPLSASASIRAIPKSARRAPAAASRTLPGFRSRWTTPRSCAWASAANSRPNTDAVSSGGSAPRAKRARRSLPSTSSIANQGMPPSLPWASTRTIAGCSRRASAAISRAKRTTISGLLASVGDRSLSATWRPPASTPR